MMLQIQCVLQDVGSAIATPRSTARDAHLSEYNLLLIPRSPPPPCQGYIKSV